MERYRDKSLGPEERAADLLGRMTLREKVGQLTQRLYGFTCCPRQGDNISLSEEFCAEVQRYGGLGALYGLHRADPWSKRDLQNGLDGVLAPKAHNLVQQYVVEHSRFGIPALMTSECPHGHQALDGYLLPVNLASAAAWDPNLLEQAAEVCGAQLRELGVDLALVSCLDVLRDPRWGRSEECFGEDPFLASAMTRAVIRGIQSRGVGVVAKHLCAQGETTGGVNASAARIGPRELREIHLPPVQAAVEAGAVGFMAAYNEIDGVYCHANPWLLRHLLREEYGFSGLVMSDGIAIDQLDAVTGDNAASGALALESGVDIGLWDNAFGRLEEAVERGLVKEDRINEAAGRILALKFRRGLFEQPFVPEGTAGYTPERFPQSERLAEESAVLLKNQGDILPLDGSKPLRILLTGPNADDIYAQLGDYTPPLRPHAGVTVRRGLEAWIQAQDSPATLIWRPGCPRFETDPAVPGGTAEASINEAVEAAREADVAIAVLGGTSSRFEGAEFQANGALDRQAQLRMDCGENVDTARLRLPGAQLELLRRLRATGKPIITVLIAGRPYEMAELRRCSDAILYCFYPGPAGGRALARLLFGDCAPAGRLPVSLPDYAGQLPVYYNYKDSYQGGRYCDVGLPAYGFGCGLSYTHFLYSLVQAPDPSGKDPAVTVEIQNVGSRAGSAVPQLYLHRAQGVVTSRARELCAFEKLRLDPGQSRRVRLALPRDSLCQWDAQMRRVLPPGRIEWSLWDQGEPRLSGSFQLPGAPL